ncbi:MAG: glycosyltransferase [Gemmatimonadaceae bacterium]
MTPAGPVRIAFVAGGLGQGGAEKQLVYMARAVRDAGADVRVYCLTRGEHYEQTLIDAGLTPIWMGRRGATMLRVLTLAAELRRFRPHIAQSAHFFMNLYVRFAAPLTGALDVGAARSDIVYEVEHNGRWGPWLVRAPSALIVNSYAAQRNTKAYGVPAERVHVLPNVIDLEAFDAASRFAMRGDSTDIVVVGIGSLIRAKRFDRFLRGLAAVRASGARVRGLLVGEGPERTALETLARELGLLPNGVEFAGRRDDIPAQLRAADVLMLTSDHEGFPNVVLEAMAASLPVISTAAGDAGAVIQNGVTGCVAPVDDEDALIEHLGALVRSRETRDKMGTAGRARVESHYSLGGLGARLLHLHRAIAAGAGHRAALAALGN